MTRMLLLAALALACAPSVAIAGALGINTPEHLYSYAVPLSVVFALVCCGLVIRAHARGTVPAPEARIWLIPLAFMATMLVGPAFAQEASSTTLGIPWGQMVAEFSKAALEIILPVLSALAVAGAARLPWWITMWLTTQRIDRMLKTGADYAINAVEGATHDKALSVDVGYPVIKTALERIMGSTPAWLVKEAGGAKGITERLFRVFKFDETVTDANTLSPLIRDLPKLPFAKVA